RVAWPPLVLQRALELVNWYTQKTLEQVSIDQRKIGEAAETYVDRLASGAEAWTVSTDQDAGIVSPSAARDRYGRSLLPGIPDRRNLVGLLTGPGWDNVN